MRVGVATAKAVAHALGVPMIGVSSLDLLAFAMRYTSRPVTAAIDARRGELFWRLRPVPGGLQRVVEPHTASPEELASELMARGDEHLLVGDGALRYRGAARCQRSVGARRRGARPPLRRPLVQLAHAQALREEWVPPPRSGAPTCASPTPRSTGRPETVG